MTKFNGVTSAATCLFWWIAFKASSPLMFLTILSNLALGVAGAWEHFTSIEREQLEALYMTMSVILSSSVHVHYWRSSWYRWHSSIRNTTMHGGRFPPSEYSCNLINHTTSTSNSREITNSIALPISHNPLPLMLQAWAYWNSHGSLTYAWVMVKCQCSLMEVYALGLMF